MGNRTMSEETKAKIAASREAKKALALATGAPLTVEKRPSIEDQLAAMQAAADGGDAGAYELLPVVECYHRALVKAKADAKEAARKVRKLLSV